MHLSIDDIAFGGEGVGRVDGKAVFVPYTIEGEKVIVEVERQRKSYAEAALESVETPSPHRVEPRCPYFGRCGGCAYQHIAYAHQLEIKARQVEQTLRRVGRFSPVPMRPIIPSPQPYEYRNRITVHSAGGVIGFFAPERLALIDVESCPIAMPAVNDALATLRARRPPDGHYSLRADRSDRTFRQVNNAVAGELLALVQRLVTPVQQVLVDAYCGSGWFAKNLRDRFERTIGIEWSEHAVTRARQGTAAGETYVCGDVAVSLGPVLQENDMSATTLIVDPPADGLAAAALGAIAMNRPAEIIYVSCNPATLARDLAKIAVGYALGSVTPLDMFPQTAGIEAVAHLRRAPDA